MRLCKQFALALVLSGPFLLRAQPPANPVKPGTLFGEEKRTGEELKAAEGLVAAKRWDDALRRFMQILSESGDQLVPLGEADARRAVPARWLVHEKLAAAGPEMRKRFREQVDGAAKKWLDEGTARRDARLLERIVHDAFCSKPAEQALHLLGDLAFERGEFEAAERWWRLLALPASALDDKGTPSNPGFGDSWLSAAPPLVLMIVAGSAGTGAAMGTVFDEGARDVVLDAAKFGCRGRLAPQVFLPWSMIRFENRSQSPLGTIFIRSCSIFTGSVFRVSPSLNVTRLT